MREYRYPADLPTLGHSDFAGSEPHPVERAQCGHILQKLQNGPLGPCKNLTIQLTYATLGHGDFASGESH
jgi:hypothetical protein